MAIDYDPKDAVQVWPAADYDAVLEKVEDKTSKRKADGTGGNPMQVWTFRVYAPDGREQLISEYVVVPQTTFKIKQLAKALGRESEFNDRKFQAENYIGSTVIAVLAIEEQEGYDEKNRIGKIKAKVRANGQSPVVVPRAASSRPQSPISEASEFQDADIPFLWSGRIAEPI